MNNKEIKELSELINHLSDSEYMNLLLFTLDKQKQLDKMLNRNMLSRNK